jgi:hypothetical protein
MEGERRLEGVVPAGQDEAVCRLRGAQRPDAELAVLQHFGVPDRDRGAAVAADGEAQPADEVLPEVDQGPAGRRGPDPHGADVLVPDDGGPHVRRQSGRVEVLGDMDAGPPVAREAGPLPGVVPQPGVDRLAVVEVVLEHVRRPCAPGLVGPDHLAVAVPEHDLELGQGTELGAVVGPAAVPSQPAAEPAVAEPEAEHQPLLVGARAHEVGDVVLAVAQPPFVAGPARAEDVVRDGRAVDRRGEHAVGGRVQRRVGDVAVPGIEPSLAAQQRCPREVLVGGDHPGDPGRGGHRLPPGWVRGS